LCPLFGTAKAADEAAGKWVAENMDAQIVTSVLG
jgi:hypothetical protein